MNLIILTEDDSIGGDRYRIDDLRVDHVRQVLRSCNGDTIEVGLLNGPTGNGIIESINTKEIILNCDMLNGPVRTVPAIDLICALPRPQTLKKVLVTSATMGVENIHLIRANRVEKSYYHSPLLEPENYTRFLVEGLSQGKRTLIPEVHIHHRFKPFFQDMLPRLEKTVDEKIHKLLPHPDSPYSLDTVLTDTDGRIILAIGPEGGWVPFETELMQESGFQMFELGPWILRVENAVTASLAQIELVRMKGSQRDPAEPA